MTIEMANRTLPYNGETQYGWNRTDEGKETVSGLVNNETVTITYTPASGKTVGTYENGSYDTETLVIKDGEADVTENYNLTSATAGKLTIAKDDKTITVESLSKSWPYDATAHTWKKYTVTYGTEVIEGTEGQVEFTLSTGDKVTITPTEKGANGVKNVSDSGANSFTWEVENADSYTIGDDTVGTLTITAKEVTVSVADKTVEYNGSEQKGETTYTFEGIVSGETATITYTPSSGTTVGTYDNGSYADDFKVMAGEENVTANYTLKTKTAGKLTITDRENPYEITVESNGFEEVVYDGQLHTAEGFKTLEFEVEGQKYTVSGLTTSDISEKNVGEYTNTISGTAVVKDAAGNDVTSQFTVNKVEGTGKITAKEVTVSVADKTVEYNGSEQKGETTYTFEGIVSGETATITYTPSSGTTVGTYDNGSYADDFKVMAGEENVTANYTLKTKTAGKLTITDRENPYEITVESNGFEEVVYDGQLHTAEGFKTLEFEVEGQKYTVSGLTTSDISEKNVGEYTNTISGTAVVKDAAGNDVTSQFTVNKVEGTGKITAKEVTVTANDKTKKYGEADPEFDAVIEGVIGDDKIEYKISREEGEDVGKYAIIPTGEEEQGNYKVTYVNGTLTIEKGHVKIKANDYTKVYGDADPEFEFTVSGLELLAKKSEGLTTFLFFSVKTVTVNNYDVEGDITREAGENVGTYKITVSDIKITKNGVDVTDNFEIEEEDGTLEITPKEITVTAENKEKNQNETDPELTAVVDGLVGDDTIDYDLDREPGEEPGTYAIHVTGEEEQGNYKITYVDGTLTIKAVDVPDTGDRSQLRFWESMYLGSTLGSMLIALLYFRKKEEYAE